MEREKIVELYEIAQEKSRGGKLIEYFAALVEQETLERAAKVCDDEADYWRQKHNEHGGYWAEDRRIGSESCADEIRNLKINNQ